MSSESFLQIAASSFPLLLKGTWLTVQISVLATFFGLVLGCVLGVLACDYLGLKFLWAPIRAYVGVFRGTPVFVQLLLIYFALPEMTGIDLSPFMAGVVTLSLNSTAYLAETIRGGINAVPIGQWEACEVLGYQKWQSLRYIILPQALRAVLPAITNELASLIKESSILMIIGVPELVKVSRDVVARELRPLEIYMMTAALYLVLTSIVAFIAHMFERKMK